MLIQLLVLCNRKARVERKPVSGTARAESSGPWRLFGWPLPEQTEVERGRDVKYDAFKPARRRWVPRAFKFQFEDRRACVKSSERSSSMQIHGRMDVLGESTRNRAGAKEDGGRKGGNKREGGKGARMEAQEVIF